MLNFFATKFSPVSKPRVYIAGTWARWGEGLSEKSPNVYKSCPKMTKAVFSRQMKDFDPFWKNSPKVFA